MRKTKFEEAERGAGVKFWPIFFIEFWLFVTTTNFILSQCEGSQKCIFHLLYASALLLSNHFVTEQQQAVRRNGDFWWPWKKDCFWTTSLKIILRIFQLKHWQTIEQPTYLASFPQNTNHFPRTGTKLNSENESHPPTNEISVGGLGESGPDVAVEIWQIGIFSNLSAHRRPPQSTCSRFATGLGGKIEIEVNVVNISKICPNSRCW